MHCRRVPTPWPRSASRCLPSPLWWISGGTASRRIWSHSVFRPCGEAGCTSACFRSSIGHTKWPTHGARAGKPSCERPWRRCKARFKRMRLLSSWPRRFLRSGKRGLSSGRRRFSAPRLPWKGAMVLWHSCIIISEACPGTDTRCGPSCITSIVAPQMERPPRPGFSGGRFRISLRRFYPRSRYCLGLGNAMTMSCYVTDVMKCPALRGYPTIRLDGQKSRQLRREKGWSPKELRKRAKCSISIAAIRYVEANKRPVYLETLRIIAEALGVDPLSLVATDKPPQGNCLCGMSAQCPHTTVRLSSRIDQCVNLLLGIAIGNAFGAGYDHLPPAEVARRFTFTRYDKAPHPQAKHRSGHYTGDTQMSLAVAEALLSGKQFTTDTLATSLRDAYHRDKKGRDYSDRTRSALEQPTVAGVQARGPSVTNGAALRAV